jgi:hypothetical protein
MARLQHEHMMDVLELAVQHAMDWEEKHPFATFAARKTNTSAKALRMGVMERKYPAPLAPAPIAAKPKGVKRKQSTGAEKKKSVAFAPQGTCRRERTDEVIDIDFGPRRPRAYYSRASIAYKPGAHAAPFNMAWADTSNCTFKKECVDFRNLKVFATDSPSLFHRAKLDPAARPGIEQGLLNGHPASQLIARSLRRSVAAFEAEGKDGTALLAEYITVSDAVVVLHKDNTVLDVRFSWLPGVEAEQQDDDKKRVQHCWTCLREAVGMNRMTARSVAYEPNADKESQASPWKRLKTGQGF